MSDEIPGLVERLKFYADAFAPDPDESYYPDRVSQAMLAAFLVQVAAALTRLSEERDEAKADARSVVKLSTENLWAECEKVDALEEALARVNADKATLRARAEAAESRLQALEAQIAATKETA